MNSLCSQRYFITVQQLEDTLKRRKISHDDVINWKHFTRYRPLVRESTSQRPMTRNFNVSFDLRLNKRLSKQSRRRWFETPSRSLLRHCNVDPDGDPSPLEHLFLVWFRTHPENFRKSVNISWLWPGDAILCHRTWSALVQVMASCLMALNHYLKQYWLTMNMILWFSFRDNVYLNTQHYTNTSFMKYTRLKWRRQSTSRRYVAYVHFADPELPLV